MMNQAVHINRIVILTTLTVGLGFVFMSLPLIKEAIPPNDFYGVSIEETRESREVWYAVNKVAGYGLALAGFCTFFLGMFSWKKAKVWSTKKLALVLFSSMLVFLVLTISISIQLALK